MTGIGENTLAQPVKPPLRERRACLAKLVKKRLTLTAAYDPERMLLELMRSRNKLPYDLYREAVASFRRRSERLDIYRLQDYAEAIPHGEAHLERAMEEVF